jgi:hypothetical protein
VPSFVHPLRLSLPKKRATPFNGELQTFSMTGGRICVPAPFAEDDLVEIKFSTACGVIQGLAGMLKPGRAKNTLVVQPFRFVAVDDQYCNNLREAIELCEPGLNNGLTHASTQ